jgi:hypothetical protein
VSGSGDLSAGLLASCRQASIHHGATHSLYLLRGKELLLLLALRLRYGGRLLLRRRHRVCVCALVAVVVGGVLSRCRVV